jgi:hypothetical protein
MRLHPFLLVGLAVLLLVSGISSAKELYRWTDENGVTHYSDSKPEGVEFERRAVTEDTPAPAPVAASEAGDGAEDAKAETAASKPKGPPSPNCILARGNLEVLLSAPDVSVDVDGDGEPELLDDDARQAQIASHRQLVKDHCDE